MEGELGHRDIRNEFRRGVKFVGNIQIYCFLAGGLLLYDFDSFSLITERERNKTVRISSL